MTSALFQLSCDVSISVFSVWIFIGDLAALDSAVCNTEDRKLFLECLSTDRFIQNNSKKFDDENQNDSYLQWLDLREIRVLDLQLHSSSENQVLFAKRILSRQKYLRRLTSDCGLSVIDILSVINGNVHTLIPVWGHGTSHADDFHLILPHLGKVQVLDLRYVGDEFDDETCADIAHFMPLLKNFYFGYSGVSCDIVQSIIQTCKLSHLNLPNTTSQQFLEAIKYCPNVSYFQHDTFYNSGDDVVYRQLPEFCPNLTSIKLKHVSTLTDDTVVLLAKSYPRLTNLNVTNDEALTDKSLVALSASCRHLERLHIKSCSVTDTGVSAVAERCPHLKVLNAWCCAAITDLSVLTLAECCPGLELVNLTGCKEVTDYSVFKLIERCTLLRFLGVKDTKSYGSVVKFAQGCNEFNFHGYSNGFCDDLSYCENMMSRVSKCNGRLEFNTYECTHVTEAVIQTILRECVEVKKVTRS